jgi:hypothetical protein
MMSSGQEKLRATVRELERELSAAHHLDAESRALLSQAASEIHDVLARRENSNGTAVSVDADSGDSIASDSIASDSVASDSVSDSAGQSGDESGTPPGGGSLVNRMNEAARRFEASHPLLSGILEQIAESLGQMGI